jgi:4-amino-4-deoxy-L-arabinose transferase-like glycosyltransferase
LLLLAVVLALFAASRLGIAGVASEREYDEGVYLCSARAVAAGHDLFTEVFSSQPPAIVEGLALALDTFGDHLLVARSFILTFALVALVAIADIARRLAGPWAGPAAAAALALGTTFTDLAHVVVAETPAIALALAAMAACLAARQRAWSSGWLLGSGALFALAALFKLIVLPLAAPIGLLLLLAPPGRDDEGKWRLDRDVAGVIVRCLTVAAGALLVLAVPLLVYDRAAMYEQVIGFHLSKHEAYDLDRLANLKRAFHHMRANAAIAVVAAAGMLAMLLRGRALAAVWLVLWMAGMLLVISVQTPLFWRHLVLVAPPVAIAAGVAVAMAAARTGRAALLPAAAVAIWTAVALYADRGLFPLLSDGARSDRSVDALAKAARWIEKNTSEDDLVGSDDQMAVFVGGRRSPPGLCDTSWARVASESLQVEEAARASVAARVIMLRAGSRLSSLPGYVGWLRRNYDQRHISLTGLGTARTIWIRREGATAKATNPPSLRDED